MSLNEKAARFDRLLVLIGLQLLRYFSPEGVGLSIKEMLLMEILGRHESMTMSALASALSLPLTTTTSAVTRMVRNGYLERSRIEADRRVVVVSLSHQGRACFEQHRRDHIAMTLDLLNALPEAEQEQVIAVLDKIATVLLPSSAEQSNDPKD